VTSIPRLKRIRKSLSDTPSVGKFPVLACNGAWRSKFKVRCLMAAQIKFNRIEMHSIFAKETIVQSLGRPSCTVWRTLV
jgi:hypothetical protein